MLQNHPRYSQNLKIVRVGVKSRTKTSNSPPETRLKRIPNVRPNSAPERRVRDDAPESFPEARARIAHEFRKVLASVSLRKIVDGASWKKFPIPTRPSLTWRSEKARSRRSVAVVLVCAYTLLLLPDSWLLAAGLWLLAACRWLLAARCWLLDTGCWLLAAC